MSNISLVYQPTFIILIEDNDSPISVAVSSTVLDDSDLTQPTEDAEFYFTNFSRLFHSANW
jgi:hypothetical protein